MNQTARINEASARRLQEIQAHAAMHYRFNLCQRTRANFRVQKSLDNLGRGTAETTSRKSHLLIHRCKRLIHIVEMHLVEFHHVFISHDHSSMATAWPDGATANQETHPIL